MLHDRRPKWFYLISLFTVFSTGVYLYYYPNPTSVDNNSSYHPLVTQADDIRAEPTRAGYFVYSNACKISELPVRNERLEHYFEPESFESCRGWNDGKPRLVGSNRTFLFIIKSALPYYVGNSTGSIQCNYRAFTWKYEQGSNKYGTMRTMYSRKVPLTSPVQILSDEFIRVDCSLDKVEVYTDFFSFVPEPTPVSDPQSRDPQSRVPQSDLPVPRPPDPPEPEYSVLVVGIDAVSRQNFLRQMSRTYKYLDTHYELVDMRGYNKIGDNTFPNLVAALTGMSEKELEQTCYPTPESTFDDCPFLWKNFSAAGFKTLYAEDSFGMSTFNYFKSGFAKSPTDTFYNIFSKESEAVIGNTKILNAHLCMGSQLIFKTVLEYALKYTSALRNYFYFAFVWTSSLTHDYLNLPRLGDSILQKFVKNLNKNGHLNRTILILTSDHGLRWGDFRETYQGHLEERLPFLFFIMPQTFKTKYRVAYSNLLYNQHRLTTPYDLHETFKDLIDVSSLKDELLRQDRGPDKDNIPRGISLFRNIPDTRGCHQAGIPAHYCTCHNKLIRTSLESPTVRELSQTLVSHINEVLLKNLTDKCHQLKVHKILSAQYEQSIFSMSSKTGNWTQRDYTISIVTVPGLAIFESTMRYDLILDTKDIVGDVSRLNVYANQSRCVDQARLKLYCYCR
ncbi:uncharacterized protein LOC103512515 [Diaphorina citri]|uniref:Uncharacterized protein LOC103512515 n=1 Tax=Diaphorina citri TaxID=121845 RepID=A0A1S3D6S8_DIACI|nr:uncharacterized protein LOC103512515 [Diaphorina citri]XP_017300924.1 uncharacterized protein LOC103512515 [Diaphorina citri]